MTWVRIDDGFADHPKIVAAGPLCAVIQIRALCYCARHLTDGFIPAGAVDGLFVGMEGISLTRGAVAGLYEVGDEAADVPWADVMVKQELWHLAPGGYSIHDYLEYNPSKRDVLQLRRKKAKAGRAGGQAYALARAQASAMAPARADAMARDEHSASEEDGSPTPTPTRKNQNLEKLKPRRRTPAPQSPPADFAEFWALYPKREAKQDAIRAWVALAPSPQLLTQILDAVRAQGRPHGPLTGARKYILHPATWLNGRRWEDEITEKDEYANFPRS